MHSFSVYFVLKQDIKFCENVTPYRFKADKSILIHEKQCQLAGNLGGQRCSMRVASGVRRAVAAYTTSNLLLVVVAIVVVAVDDAMHDWLTASLLISTIDFNQQPPQAARDHLSEYGSFPICA